MMDYGTQLRLEWFKQLQEMIENVELMDKPELMQGALHDQGTVSSH